MGQFTKVKYVGNSCYWFDYGKTYWVSFSISGDVPNVHVYAADNYDAWFVNINEARYERDFYCVI